MSRYRDDPRVSGYGSDGFSVSRDGTDYRVLPTGVFGWVVCTGPNLDFVAAADGGFAIGFASADDAIGAALGEAAADTGTAADEAHADAATAEDTGDLDERSDVDSSSNDPRPNADVSTRDDCNGM